jgi:hypothetical protein
MFAGPSTPPDAVETERRRIVLNEKYKAQSGFFYNLAVAIVTAGPVASLIRQNPSFDLLLIVLSCAFGSFFYLIGNNRLDQMVE